MRIRTVIVDDGAASRQGLEPLLAASDVLQLVGQARDEEEALQLVRLVEPEVVLVNLDSPKLDGIAVISRVCLRWPHITVLALATLAHQSLLRSALEAGAAGHLPHDVTPGAFAGALLHLLESRQAVPPAPEPRPEPALPHAYAHFPGELAEAARIQYSILPANTPELAGWDLAVRLHPAHETSGDFYDFIPLEHGKLGLMVADVSDKGLGAALFMALTSSLFRTFIARHPTLPALAISLVNERILSDTRGSSFVTAFLGVLEPNTGRLRYVNAGHNPPYLLSVQKGKAIDRLRLTGMALGIMNEATWQQKMVKFIPGDLLMIYTDGITEAQNSRGSFYGERRLLDMTRSMRGHPAAEIQEAVLADVFDFVGQAPMQDDIIVMVLARKS
jgi:sigma-B regulation protein RsbU (phosphoserine phosphatase)